MEKAVGRVSQSRFVLLGLLRTHAGSGYDLRQRIDTSVGMFWRESWGQIYPTLRRLQAEKLVKCAVEAGQGRPDRRVYTITRQGIRVLKDWLDEPVRPAVPRNEMLLKLFFARALSPMQNLRLVSERRARSAQELARYQALEQEMRQTYPDHPDLPYWLMTLRHGIRHTGVEMEWCDETSLLLQTLTKIPSQS